MTRSAKQRRWLAAIVTGALAASAARCSPPFPAAAEEPRTFALVGSLQSELGCSADWQPDCAATELAPTATPGVYATEFTIPAGSWSTRSP